MKISIHKWVLYMMVLTLSCRCLITLMPALGLPLISTGLAAMCFISQIYCFCYAIAHKNVVSDMRINLLFLVYSLFITHQLFFSGILASDQCEGTPQNMIAMLRGTFDIIMLSQIALIASKFLDFRKFAKYTCIITLMFALLYNYKVGYFYYPLTVGLSHKAIEQIVPNGFMSALTMNSYIGLLLCCAIYLLGKWSIYKSIVNYLIPISIIILGLVLMFMMGERGPLLFIFATILVYLAAKSAMNRTIFISLVLVLILCVVFSNEILTTLSDYFPEMINKFSDKEGSGRIGSSDSIYAVSFRQFIEHPFFGYHCRLLSPNLIGSYAHNIVLELLMTVGVVFTIPILYLLSIAFIQSYRLIKYNRPESLIGIIFIYRTLCLLTSASIVLNTQFWFSFMFVLATRKYIDFEKDTSTSSNNG